LDDGGRDLPRPCGGIIDERVNEAPGRRARRVLVIDDHDDAAELTAELLRHHGYEVAVAHGGHEALELASSFTPDVALLDIALPDMDGYELARRLRPTLTSCRFVALTGFVGTDVRTRAAEAGCALHLVKPVRIADLLAALQ
jgi:CheY-like chemotaxis protein